MKIEEKEPDKERSGSWAILVKNYWMDLHVVNYQPTVLECHNTKLSFDYTTCVVVDHNLRDHTAVGRN
jgi:hypothetical protein